MFNNYVIYIREDIISRNYWVSGCEAAFEAYKAAKAFVEAVGIDASVDLVDGTTGEVLASNEFEIHG